MASSYGLSSWAERSGPFTDRMSVVSIDRAGPWITIEDTQRGRMQQRFHRRLLPYFVWYSETVGKVYIGSRAEIPGQPGYRLYLQLRENEKVKPFVQTLFRMRFSDVDWKPVTDDFINRTFETRRNGEPSAGQHEVAKRKIGVNSGTGRKSLRVPISETVSKGEGSLHSTMSMNTVITSIEMDPPQSVDTSAKIGRVNLVFPGQEAQRGPSYSPLSDDTTANGGPTAPVASHEQRIRDLEEDAKAYQEQKKVQKQMLHTLKAMLECIGMSESDIDECAMRILDGDSAQEVMTEWAQQTEPTA